MDRLLNKVFMLLVLLVVGYVVLSGALSKLGIGGGGGAGNGAVAPATRVAWKQQELKPLSPGEEIAFGQAEIPSFAARYGGLVEAPDERARYVSEIGTKLVRRTLAGNGEFGAYYQFHLLNFAKPEGFGEPGGQVYVSSGLYAMCENEAQLAGALAHEMGHVIKHHVILRTRMGNATQAATAAAGTLGDVSDFAQRAYFAYSRQEEYEADHLGAQLMVEAGYDPRAAIVMLQHYQQTAEGKLPTTAYSNHPGAAERIANLQAVLQADFPNGLPAGLTMEGVLLRPPVLTPVH